MSESTVSGTESRDSEIGVRDFAFRRIKELIGFVELTDNRVNEGFDGFVPFRSISDWDSEFELYHQ